MTSWLARDGYHPLWILAAGTMTYLGALGVGGMLLRLGRVRVSTPWDTVIALLLGLQVMSLGVQLLGMAALASRSPLLVWLGLFWFAGAAEAVRAIRVRRFAFPLKETQDVPWLRAVLLVLVLSLSVNLVIALAPSTKADEVYYHMLVPSRVVADEALRFYAMPWEGAGFPQMGYALASAPLHAARLPDAANVVSWALSLTMLWFFYRLLRAANHSRVWAVAWCTALVVGLHSAVWHVTAGSHAMGELSIAALLIAVCIPETVRVRESGATYAFVIGVLASAGAGSKITTVPIALALLCAGLVRLCRGQSARETARLCCAAVLPGVALYLPLVGWTWSASGAPFGPVGSSWFPNSVFASLPTADAFKGAIGPITLLDAITRHSPLVWLAAVGAIVFSTIAPSIRLLLGALIAAQMLAICLQTTCDPRFLSGLPAGCAVVFALAAPAWAKPALQPRIVRWLVLPALVLPWSLAALIYGRPFAGVVFGLESSEEFKERYVAYYADYRALDSLLPPNAVLYATGRISAAYAPRPVVWTPIDIPRGANVFQFDESCDLLHASFDSAGIAYRNPVARAAVYRNPQYPPELAPLCVRRIELKLTAPTWPATGQAR